MSGIAIITEACIETKDRACVDVCPVQCIYEFDPVKNILFSEVEAGSGTIENSHAPNPDAVAIFGDSILYVNTDECTSCTACYQPDVCPVGAIYVPTVRRVRRTTPLTRVKATITRSSSSSAETCSQTDGPIGSHRGNAHRSAAMKSAAALCMR